MKELIKFKVIDGEKELELSFMEPNKAVLKEGESVNSVTFANCIREGYLTTQEVIKIYAERDGIFTEAENEEFKKNLTDYLAADKKVKDGQLAGIVDEESVRDFEIYKARVLHYYNRQDSVFEFTAERKARDVTLVHYALALVYLGDKPYFEGKDFKTRQKNFDDNTTPIKEEVLKRGVWYATAYVSGVKFDEVPFPEDVKSKEPELKS